MKAARSQESGVTPQITSGVSTAIQNSDWQENKHQRLHEEERYLQVRFALRTTIVMLKLC